MFQLGTAATGKEDLSKYLISNKLDGLRAMWDGKKLISRGGCFYPAPTDFLNTLPDLRNFRGTLDGELFIRTNNFQYTSSVVRGQGNDWIGQGVRFVIFDANMTGTFEERLDSILSEFGEDSTDYSTSWRLIRHRRMDGWTHEYLMREVREYAKTGGEGKMLQLRDSHYKVGRSRNVLKVKLPDYGWCRITGTTDGTGKYAGLIGAYTVAGLLATPMAGLNWKIGSGLSDYQRQNALLPGTLMPFRHWGTYASGRPRQPVFVDIGQLPPGCAMPKG